MKRILGIAMAFLTSVVLIHPLFGQEQGAAASAPVPKATPATPVAPKETVWLDDDPPANAKTQGIWIWDTTTFTSGGKSHGHPSAKGLQSHGFTADPATFDINSMVTQQVWLDPSDPPKGIMLKLKLTTGDEVGVYWEGDEGVFNPGEEEEVWYCGLLPG